MATKIAVGIVPAEGSEAVEVWCWLSDGSDIRGDARVAAEVLAFVEAAGVQSLAMADHVLGCPHEEGIDYEGPTCPACLFWAGGDRWTGPGMH